MVSTGVRGGLDRVRGKKGIRMSTVMEAASLSCDLREIIREIVESIFSDMLQLSTEFDCAPTEVSKERLQASVDLTGDWNGTVAVRCSRKLAGIFAARYLSLDPGELPEALVSDFLAELANILAGNLKGVLGTRIAISRSNPSRPISESPSAPHHIYRFEDETCEVIVAPEHRQKPVDVLTNASGFSIS